MNKNIIKSQIIKNLSFFLSAPAIIWVLGFLYIPLLFTIAISFIKRWVAASWPEFGFDNYLTFFDSVYFTIIYRSLLLACVTTLVCFLCAYPIAYFLALRARRWKNFLLYLLALPFGVNFVILAYSWFFVLEKSGLINNILMAVGLINEPIQLLNTPFAVYLGMIYCYLPFMVLPIYAILEKLDIRLIEASSDLGATPFTTFFRIILPLSLPGIQTGFFMVFVPSFGEYVIPALMGGGKYMYVGSLITHYFIMLRNIPLGAAFTVFSSLILLIITLLVYWRFKQAES